MKKIKIGDKSIKNFGKPYIIAEACINHQGDFEIAKEMVYVAKAAKCDAIKFQIHQLDDEMLTDTPISKNFGDKSLYQALDETNLSIEELSNLKKICEDIEIEFLCTPFSFKSCDILVNKIGVNAIKVGSGECTNHPLQKHIASKKKTVIFSTGMTEFNEVKETYNLYKKQKVDFAMMHCVSAYPCPYEIMNLGLIKNYIEKFKVPIGLSDHTPTIYCALVAVSHGACLIEKHFTLDKSMKGPDHQSSIDSKELFELVEGCNAVFKSMGDKRKIHKEEKEIVLWARESVVSLKNISVGELLSSKNISVKRPSPGKNNIPAKDLDRVIGKKAKKFIKKDSQLLLSDVF
ncbi:MAG: CMP-N-acetylneuraminic acid synthetase [Candidatus Marinimicrobia bacterium]|nr:CMP-N-acetylneuraminic acid synthetase [Candidatus Neomarinimicrobiota bacterium]|tara:strand:- start:1606 stop:2646 length:1041 start_codon:yes stop_codon:yes gene_type:complete